jgi:hypothetical protein
MATELENGKEWAHRTAEHVVRELGMDGDLEWIPDDRGKLALVLKAGENATEVIALDEIQLKRATYDFLIQYSLGAEIRSAVMDVHLRA